MFQYIVSEYGAQRNASGLCSAADSLATQHDHVWEASGTSFSAHERTVGTVPEDTASTTPRGAMSSRA